MEINLEDFVSKVIECLEESDITYVVIGTITSSYYGRSRSTTDVDILIDDTPKKIHQLENTFKKHEFELSENEISEAVAEESHCSIFLNNCPFRVDISGNYSSVSSRALKNRLLLKIFTKEGYIQKAEDLIIGKLVYGKDGNSRDYEDALSVLIRQKDKLDFQYLRFFSAKEGVLGELEELIEKIEM